uniref:Uncharacterized protein n=1 Tax=Anguilla anguilla TaxID=7936 RepID=A0A0E9SAM2_ANGAN
MDTSSSPCGDDSITHWVDLTATITPLYICPSKP